MLERTKNLYPNGNLKMSVSVSNAIIVDIPSKIGLLKSYKLQFSMLGFIAIGNKTVKSKKPIHSLINRQISRNDKSYFSDREYHNARILLLKYFKNPEMLTPNISIYRHFLEAFDTIYNCGKKGVSNPHVVIINRLFRKNKGQALYKHIESLQGL